jgi:hypothetical protein
VKSFLNNISASVYIVTEERMHPMFSFPNNVFKHPAVLIYNLFHIYFHLKDNLLYSHPSTLHGSAIRVYGHHQVFSILLKLLHCTSKFRIACERVIS